MWKCANMVLGTCQLQRYRAERVFIGGSEALLLAADREVCSTTFMLQGMQDRPYDLCHPGGGGDFNVDRKVINVETHRDRKLPHCLQHAESIQLALVSC
jgi:hypothetical protein